ncbi:hypothetical protein J7I93_15460 [Bacillus sp. ISL-47]|uniref:hypothetical protein n=1 Tax=Bacillus sp. ISL-47 TaxID=2819130 RepID=UPI001BEC6303|nr:hypothetical protein [Bacillus sp. ISL-47]MBT2689588.1 hypothetical protein [Bacillus sp. ISL-47]MBT2708407.1 hypothetical protein [Pseudomonas sp. ISL-84]
MGNAVQSEMVKHTLQEIYHRGGGFPRKPYVLALLTSHMIGMEPGFSYLKELQKDSITLRITGEDSIVDRMQPGELIKAVGNDDWIPQSFLSEKILREIDGIFLPILSFSLINDLLSLNDQRPFVRIILEALLQGKKVAALKTGSDPHDPYWKMKGMDKGPALLKRTLLQQLVQLKSMGITVISDNEKADFTPEMNKKTVISEETIRYAHQHNQTVIRIHSGSIITPLARDVAKELNILLKTF